MEQQSDGSYVILESAAAIFNINNGIVSTHVLAFEYCNTINNLCHIAASGGWFQEYIPDSDKTTVQNKSGQNLHHVLKAHLDAYRSL